MDAGELVRAGAAAAQLLESEDFKLGLEAVRAQAFQSWASTQPEQAKEREEFYFLLLATNKLELYFRQLAEGGRYEERKAAEKDKRAQQPTGDYA